ncbi:hypothetical protein [Streptomyces jumonjinensis]|uniref:Uncharacterized protein n=1 Tax=Streptomyces jumonjinensis TaxID=1945 RepID=A0A646KL58_STRJU|nr:hypothetical protein [Streptomyces jumonjinensis]MQT02810.1 hypothetical protein [Streptomyces jumonjinensis]
MMSSMHTPTDDPLDVETFASPAQQRRYTAAMERIAAARPHGTPVRVYVSAAPKMMDSPKWDSWLAQITEELPAGVEILHYRNTFDERSYDWDSLVEQLEGLVIIGKQKRAGSRVNLLGPVARLELRSLIAQKPVLLYGHSLGLIPVIDCRSQVLRPEGIPRLKLIAPKRWKKDAATLNAALKALGPGNIESEEEVNAAAPVHLAHPFATPPR